MKTITYIVTKKKKKKVPGGTMTAIMLDLIGSSLSLSLSLSFPLFYKILGHNNISLSFIYLLDLLLKKKKKKR
ncbi:hypothetical protein BD770DRAFT_239766 [Pilaira anomala]|nr:hypothetical protein BD770DRAFT_239766 [Pilaira anomala]